MNRNSKHKFPEALGAGRSGCGRWWTRAAVVAVVVALFVGLTGCADVLGPLYADDLPFEQDTTTFPDIGAVDNVPTVPVDDSFGSIGDRPF